VITPPSEQELKSDRRELSSLCDEPAESEGMEHFFTAGYRRIVLDGVGHFPPRESPEAVVEAVLAHVR
jgi:pimeloyl-ACP methyl ester carboxylesterase